MNFIPELSGPFAENAASAAVLIIGFSFMVRGERLLRWSALIALWQFFTPRHYNLPLDLALLNLYLLSAELVYMVVVEALRRRSKPS